MTAFDNYERDQVYDLIKELVQSDVESGISLGDAVERIHEIVGYSLSSVIDEVIAENEHN